MSDQKSIDLDATKTQKLRVRFAQFKRDNEDKSAPIRDLPKPDGQKRIRVRSR